jgi:hypothetical protein
MDEPKYPRFALEPVRVDSSEGAGPWLRVMMFLFVGIIFALGFLIGN